MKTLRGSAEVYLRNLVFGVEDGLVSTVGLLSGIAIAGVPRPTIFLTGVILIFVEAVSMAAGSYLSEASVDEREHVKNVPAKSSEAGIVMFISYFVAGFIPLFPYVVYEVGTAFPLSIAVSLVALFLLGYWSGRKLRSAARMAFIGGAAIAVGILAGQLVS